MGAQYAIVLRDGFGNVNRVLSNVNAFEWTRVVNKVGSLVLTLPDQWDSRRNLSTFDIFQAVDAQVEIWRQIDGGAPTLEGETPWFNRQPARILEDSGRRLIQLNCVDAIELLSRRIIFPPRTVNDYNTSGVVDDAMKDIIADNWISTGVTARNVAWLTAQAKLTQSSTTWPGLKQYEWANVLGAFREQAAASQNDVTTPVYLAFDVVYNGPNALEFRTYKTQRGLDHRAVTGAAGPVILDPDFGNLAAVELDLDYSKEITFVAVSGSWQTDSDEDTARSGASAYNRREAGRLDRNTGSHQTNPAVAAQLVREGRPRKIFSGRVVQTAGAMYGKHWGFGDAITANYLTNALNCRIDALHVRVDSSGETIDVAVRQDDAL